jgi:hypothetical protein
LIRCTKCGTINADTDIFCGKCASFLEWTGVKVDAAEVDDSPITVADATAAPPIDSSSPAPPLPAAPVKTDEPLAAGAPPPTLAEQPAPPPPAAAPPPPVAAAPVMPPATTAATPPLPDQAALEQAGPFGASAPPPTAAPAAPANPAALRAGAAQVETPPEPVKPAPPPPPPSFRFRAQRASQAPAAAVPPAASAAALAASSQGTADADEPAAVKPGAAQPPARAPKAVAAEEPIARQPTLAPPPPRPAPQAHPSLVEEPEIKPGDLICGVCGAGNTPDRRFCRRCGNSLAAATVAVAVRRPWYRRIFGRGSKTQTMAAGDRPSSLGRKGRSAGWFVKRLIVVAIVVALIAPVVGYFAVPSFKEQINSLLGQSGASVILLQHPSTNALDKDINTFWLADQASGHTTVTVNFGQTTSLAGLIFHSGAPGTDYTTYGRPLEVQLVFPGNPNPVTMRLNDDPAPQKLCLPTVASARTFDIRIVSSFPPSGSNQNLVALREVEFIAGSCP